jgi:hypothetical protein
MLNVAEMLFAASGQGTRPFSSVPYTGSGGVRTLPVGVDATPGGLTILKQLSGTTNDPAFFDTVRGASFRGRYSKGDDVFSALSFSGKSRILTGANYNASVTDYVAWNFAKLANFMDVVTFNGGSGPVSHALGQAPALFLVFQRTGAGSQRTFLWASIDTEFVRDTSLVSGTLCSSVTSTTFNPNSTVFVAGNTYVAYLFATAVNRLAKGFYTGNTAFNTVGSQTVPLAFAPSFLLLYGRTSAAGGLSPYGGRIYDAKLSSNQYFFGGALPFSISGTDLIASSTSQPSNPSAATTACMLGERYRYVAIR